MQTMSEGDSGLHYQGEDCDMQNKIRLQRDGVLVFLALFVLYALRDIPGALAPPLFNEDGPNMLDFYTAGHAPERIFRFYGGYISVGPNLIGYLIGFLPVSHAIYVLYWVPMAISAVTFAILCHPSFSLPDITRHERVFIALLLGLFPASNMALMTNTTFALWHLAILLFFMGLLWTPQTAKGALLGSLFGAIAATSHPVSVILLPVLLWRVWSAKTPLERFAFLPIAGVIPIYIILGVSPDSAGGPLDVVGTLWEAVRLFSERGIFETLFSTRVRSIFLHRGLEPVMWIFCIGLLSVMIWHVKGRIRLLVVTLLLLGFGNSLFCAVAREMSLNNTWGHRYGYLTGVLFLLAMAISLLPVLRHWQPVRFWIRPAFLIVLAGASLMSAMLKLPYYINDSVKGAEVAQLISALEGVEDIYCLRVDRGEWSFEIRDSPEAECITLPAIEK